MAVAGEVMGRAGSSAYYVPASDSRDHLAAVELVGLPGRLVVLAIFSATEVVWLRMGAWLLGGQSRLFDCGGGHKDTATNGTCTQYHR